MTLISVGVNAPESWLFYIVAKLGPGGAHRPLAVTLLGGTADNSICGSNLARACLQIIAILSDPANERAIRGELRLAGEFYGNSSNDPPRAEVPEPTPGAAFLGILDLVEEELLQGEQRAWDRGFKEFPFLSTCLLLGAGYDPSTGASYQVRTEPLGTVYRDDSHEYGMVVLDVSEPERIRYGIVGFIVHDMVEVDVDEDWDYDAVEDGLLESEPVPTVEGYRPRLPLSAKGYMTKFHYYGSQETVSALEQRPLVDVAALDYIWPTGVPSPGSATLGGAKVEIPTTGQPLGSSRRATLGDQAIASLICSTQEQESFNLSIFDDARLIPNFSSRLLRLLQDHPGRLGSTRAAGQLLGLAYAGHEHLDWIPYTHLSANGMTAALESPGLKTAKTLSVCIHDTTNCDQTAQLAKLLPQLENLQLLCVLQQPTRTNDDASATLFTQLSAASIADPKARRLLQEARIVLTGAHSASLRKTFWLPTTDYTPAEHAFPVQQMLVRHQRDTPTTDDDDNSSFKFWPNHFYLGDALLSPQRFASGFLRFLRSVNTDDHLFPFATAPSTLADLGPPSAFPSSAAPISPIPPELFTIPIRPLLTGSQHSYDIAITAECWAKPRDLLPGAWTVLVSQHRYFDADAAALNEQTYGHRPTEARVIRYAFVRAKVTVAVEGVSATEMRTRRLGDEEVEVADLEGFLHQTAPGAVDPAVLRTRVAELVRDLENCTAYEPARRLGGQAQLAPGMEWLAVMGREEACEVLREFLVDTAFVRRNLRLAMEEDPSGRNWYPELLQGGASRDTESKSRVGTVFRALHESPV